MTVRAVLPGGSSYVPYPKHVYLQIAKSKIVSTNRGDFVLENPENRIFKYKLRPYAGVEEGHWDQPGIGVNEYIL